MNNKVRRSELYALLKKKKVIQVSEAAEELGVSNMTIRRDLIEMEKEELITRAYGKAILRDSTTATEDKFKEREFLNADVKERMAHEALSLLDGASSIFLDGSSTCNALARILPQNAKLTVVTCNLNALFYLRDMSNINVYALGGMLMPDRNNTDGEYTYQMARKIYVDIAFISCGGYSEKGLVNGVLDGLQTCNIMLGHADTCVVLADHSKYMHRGLFNFANWNQINHFVTDKMPEDSMLEMLRKNNITLHVADENRD